MMELPAQFYYIVGFLIITNIGAIGSLLMVGFRAVWWSAKIDSRLEETKAMAVRAHKRIDKIEET